MVWCNLLLNLYKFSNSINHPGDMKPIYKHSNFIFNYRCGGSTVKPLTLSYFRRAVAFGNCGAIRGGIRPLTIKLYSNETF